MNRSRNLLVASALATCAVFILALYYGVPLEIAAAGLAALGVLLFLISHSPEILLVAAMFAPQWKAYWPFNIVDRIADLTILMVSCVVLSIVWRMFLFRASKKWNLQKLLFGQSHVLLAYSFFAAVVTFSYTYTTAPNYGGEKLLRFLMFGTFMLVAPFFLILSELDFRRFAIIFVFFSLVQSFLLVTHLETRATDDKLDITRIGAGWLLGMALILILFYRLFPTKRAQGAVYAFALPIIAIGLIASAARGPMVSSAGIIFLGGAIAIHRGQLKATTAISLIAILAVLGSVAFLVLRQADPQKFSAKATELEELSTGGSASGSAAKRLAFYDAAVHAIPDHPLLGRGIGSWAVYYFGNDVRNYPHNLVLELTFEEGFLGLAAFAAFLLALGVSIRPMMRASRFHFLVLPLMVAYCVSTSMFSGDLDDNRLIWLWAGVALAICRLVSLRAREVARFRNETFVPSPAQYDFPRVAYSRAEREFPALKSTRGAAWR